MRENKIETKSIVFNSDSQYLNTETPSISYTIFLYIRLVVIL